ncbi:hypothetical protein A4A49_22644 [Nicotiana attenuata]|uniref:Uncharacterized protein n=1 Tax=Nicotiana attenuata TaxID=49451 RepID=A0A314KTL8_NICAT|nr:hypothetical protein A4A49_22644 [Nicotiana attenuata]
MYYSHYFNFCFNLIYLMANSRVRSRELKECYFLEPDSRNLHGHCVFEIALREANRASDNRDTCAYVVSLLTVVNPDLMDVLMNRLTELGIRVIHTVKQPSQAEEYMIDYHVKRNFYHGQILVLFGITILLLFKNVSQGNYS